MRVAGACPRVHTGRVCVQVRSRVRRIFWDLCMHVCCWHVSARAHWLLLCPGMHVFARKCVMVRTRMCHVAHAKRIHGPAHACRWRSLPSTGISPFSECASGTASAVQALSAPHPFTPAPLHRPSILVAPVRQPLRATASSTPLTPPPPSFPFPLLGAGMRQVLLRRLLHGACPRVRPGTPILSVTTFPSRTWCTQAAAGAGATSTASYRGTRLGSGPLVRVHACLRMCTRSYMLVRVCMRMCVLTCFTHLPSI